MTFFVFRITFSVFPLGDDHGQGNVVRSGMSSMVCRSIHSPAWNSCGRSWNPYNASPTPGSQEIICQATSQPNNSLHLWLQSIINYPGLPGTSFFIDPIENVGRFTLGRVIIYEGVGELFVDILVPCGSVAHVSCVPWSGIDR